MHEPRKRVAVVFAEYALENTEFKIAMDNEIASFALMIASKSLNSLTSKKAQT